MKKKLLCLTLSFVFLLCGCGEVKDETVPAVSQQQPEVEYINILTLGDNLLHMPVVNSGRQSDGTYKFGHLYENIRDYIEKADLAVIGQETPFGGAEFGYSGYPMFNSPSDMGKTLYEEGFNVILHASNHILDKGVKGAENTLSFWKAYPDVTVLGVNESPEAKEKVVIKEVKGAKLALLNYTYGTNGITLPYGKEYLVNYIDEEKIHSDAVFAEENADFTVAFMHWGTEYRMKPDSSQKELAKKMCEWGIDLVIGAHPHVIEPFEIIEAENGNKMPVYYSLGNYVSRQKEARNLLGALADVTLKYDGKSVTIENCSFVPIVTHYNTACNKFSVYPLSEYSNELAAQHGVRQYDGEITVEEWQKIIADTFEGYDTSVIK